MMLNRVSLNTIGLNRIGLNRIGKPSRASSERPYIDPEVLASLKAVCICYGKSNDDPDRAVVKNLVDPDNPFVISNAAFKLNSGFGLYAADFLDWTSSKDAQKTSFEVKITSSNYKENWVAYKAPNTTFKAMKVRISGIPDGGALQFFRTTADGGGIKMVNGINEIPAFTNTVAAGFYIDIPLGFDWSNLVIEQIPSFEGAFVTDGVDDLIKSTKSATEMLDGSNEVTVVSMIHQIKTNSDVTRNNWFFTPVSYLENRVVENKTGKTGIYGYTSTNVTNAQISDITPILGDKNDYTLYSKIEDGDRDYFTVEGFQNQGIWYVSSIAWYWTIIANKVLTTDQINQVIAYFNLDRTLKPDILCNTIKQGITNENHAEFGDRLIDFSGNGRDIQLNNIAWNKDSGIGKYATDFTSWLNKPTETFHSKSILEAGNVLRTKSAVPSMKVKVQFDKEIGKLSFRYFEEGVSKFIYINSSGEYSLPPLEEVGINEWEGFSNSNESSSVTITQIPSHAGGLCLDGINDFGKVTGMPIYKDYTFIIDYERISYASSEKWVAGVVSKSHVANQGAFILMVANTEVEPGKQAYSFGGVNSFNRDDFTRALLYQSKYKCGDVNLTIGKGVDNDTLWLGTFRDNDQRFFNGAIYSLMSFPYSMSEFLIERQLKKHKLGTLYPNMVEFRPIVKSNLPYSSITYSVNPGEYISVDSMVTITVTLPNTSDKLMEVSCNAISDISISGDNGVYEITGKIVKSPQKINLVISSYLTMLSNSTLISNETLIKNE